MAYTSERGHCGEEGCMRFRNTGKLEDKNQCATDGCHGIRNAFGCKNMKWGSVTADGTNRNTLRSRAIKTDTLACPNATNMFWQARCIPKMVMPARDNP